MRITFLGTGTSNGIPVIGCECPVCRSEDPRDKRTRTSAVIQSGGKTLLIDTSPELRLQAVANDVRDVDAVLYTHPHADHVAGFDDLRRFNQIRQAPLDVHTDALTAGNILERFRYAFEDPFPFYGGKPDLNMHVFDGPFEAAGIPIVPFQVTHGRWTVNGFRFENLVYLTDAKEIPDWSLDIMRGAEVVVINALRDEPHPVHLSLQQALDIVDEVGAKRAYIVHISHELGTHASVNARLPSHVQLAYDGLTMDVGELGEQD